MNHFAVHQKLTKHCKSTILQLKKIKKTPPNVGKNVEQPKLSYIICGRKRHHHSGNSSKFSIKLNIYLHLIQQLYS